MHFSIAVLGFLASLASSAVLPLGSPFSLKNMVPTNTQTTPPTCSIAKVQQPTAPTPLPSPSAGNVLSMIVVGRGTQNYTCADASPTTTPTANGALANLYDASCIAKSSPSTLAALTTAVQRITLAQIPTQLVAAGHHYFFDTTTPAFDMTDAAMGLTMTKKAGVSNAPNATNGDVPWLYLKAQTQGTTGDVREIYRLNTNGGAAPKTCDGQPAAFEVQYSAEYWLYTAPS